jgi:hypothetical protein
MDHQLSYMQLMDYLFTTILSLDRRVWLRIQEAFLGVGRVTEGREVFIPVITVLHDVKL